jgi:hypothetical protein
MGRKPKAPEHETIDQLKVRWAEMKRAAAENVLRGGPRVRKINPRL